MLGEAFLHILSHRGENSDHTSPTDQNTQARVLSHAASPPETTVTNLTSRSPMTVRVSRHEGLEKPGPRLTSAPSVAVAVPSCSVEDHWGTELYRSWCCPSFCKAYPDLQLGGDTLGPHHPHKLDHLKLPSLGPLLQSLDLGSLEALEEPGELLDPQPEPDEGYLVIESMQGLGWESRLTNSMLNGYLETKLMEVYRQHMQDSLARCASSDDVPALVPANLSAPDGQMTSETDGLDSNPSHTGVQYLSTCSAPATSHFSSPMLRISYPEEQKS